jgi:hypothetical protein
MTESGERIHNATILTGKLRERKQKNHHRDHRGIKDDSLRSLRAFIKVYE